MAIRIPLVLTVVAVTGAMSGMALASPELGEDCVACHSDPSVLPETHPPVEGMTSEMCQACHKTESAIEPCDTLLNTACLQPAGVYKLAPQAGE